MPDMILGFEYDFMTSYHQKDNKERRGDKVNRRVGDQ